MAIEKAEKQQAELDTLDKNSGPSKTWLLWCNMILPLLFIPTFFILHGQTGLILHDNDKIAQNETDFLEGKADPS